MALDFDITVECCNLGIVGERLFISIMEAKYNLTNICLYDKIPFIIYLTNFYWLFMMPPLQL